MIRFGHIDQIGDSSKDEEKGRYRVRLDGDDIVTGWLFQMKQSVVKNQQDWVYDLQEPVAVMLCDDYRTGIIIGAYNTKNSPQKETDKDIEQMYFSDDSYVKYDRKNHHYEIFIKDGTVSLKSDKDFKIDSANGKVIINGGNNEGIPIEQKIEENFNNLKTYIDNIKTAVETGFTAVGTAMAASGPNGKAAMELALVGNTFTVEDMKDNNATH